MWLVTFNVTKKKKKKSVFCLQYNYAPASIQANLSSSTFSFIRNFNFKA